MKFRCIIQLSKKILVRRIINTNLVRMGIKIPVIMKLAMEKTNIEIKENLTFRLMISLKAIPNIRMKMKS